MTLGELIADHSGLSLIIGIVVIAGFYYGLRAYNEKKKFKKKIGERVKEVKKGDTLTTQEVKDELYPPEPPKLTGESLNDFEKELGKMFEPTIDESLDKVDFGRMADNVLTNIESQKNEIKVDIGEFSKELENQKMNNILVLDKKIEIVSARKDKIKELAMGMAKVYLELDKQESQLVNLHSDLVRLQNLDSEKQLKLGDDNGKEN